MNLSTHGAKILFQQITERNIDISGDDGVAKMNEIIIEMGLECPGTNHLAETIMTLLKEEKNERILLAFSNGQKQAIKPLIGQVMQIYRGADPAWVGKLMMAGATQEVQKGILANRAYYPDDFGDD